MKIRCHYFVLASVLLVLLSACGGNKKEQSSDPLVQNDITRPPVFVKTGELNQETDPDETISAEEWEKQRTQAQE